MADKQERGILQSVIPGEEVVSLASKQLKTVRKEVTQVETRKVLNKRKRKWRKRHKLPFQEHQALDPQLREEKELLYESLVELKEELVKKRRNGLETAMQLQREKGNYCLQVIQQRLHEFAEAFKPVREASLKTTVQPPPTREWLSLEEEITKELQTTIDQCATLAETRQMKHHMTPRLPPLHDRTLSKSYLDASFGFFNDHHADEIPLATTTRGTEAASMHGATSHIAPELAIIHSEEDINGYNHSEEMEIVNEDQLPVIAETVERSCGDQTEEEKLQEANAQLSSNPKQCDTEYLINLTATEVQGSPNQHSNVTYNVTSEHNPNSSATFTVATTPSKASGSDGAQMSVMEATLECGELSSVDEGGEEEVVPNSTDTDSDSQSYSKLLKNIERAPYDLRVRVRNSERLKRMSRAYYGPYTII